MASFLQHETVCGICVRAECPEPIHGDRKDTATLLRCALCPTACHYGCAGYYDAEGAVLGLDMTFEH
jgi:hypothetical protein